MAALASGGGGGSVEGGGGGGGGGGGIAATSEVGSFGGGLPEDVARFYAGNIVLALRSIHGEMRKKSVHRLKVSVLFFLNSCFLACHYYYCSCCTYTCYFKHHPWLFLCLTACLSFLARGVSHRDLNPSNLLLDDHGYLKLFNFTRGKKLPHRAPVPRPRVVSNPSELVKNAKWAKKPSSPFHAEVSEYEAAVQQRANKDVDKEGDGGGSEDDGDGGGDGLSSSSLLRPPPPPEAARVFDPIYAITKLSHEKSVVEAKRNGTEEPPGPEPTQPAYVREANVSGGINKEFELVAAVVKQKTFFLK
jgi:serine/threonine protein kinase